GIPHSSAFHVELHDKNSALRSRFFVVPHGPTYLRCRIRWDGSFENYLNSLSKVTRKDLRRTLKNSEPEVGAGLRIVRFTQLAKIDEFFRQAGKVADKTYQAKLLGLGLTQNTGLRQTLTHAARSGRFLGHILYVGDEPAAFHCGYIHGTCFYMTDGGYDPRWSKAQLGSFIFLKVLQDIETQKDPVTVLDYLYGDSTYKKRTSNVVEPERHYYLIRKSVSGAVLATAMHVTDGLSRGLGATLDRYGLKDFVKRMLRGGAVRYWSLIPVFQALQDTYSITGSLGAA
ncbi:MAG: GNAT family N-acetyltransferase, partial [Alphaproteobacteria bacterium]|nr:GNAT family N-acetyltransferase [Alphaproteobacteria bacterium]